MTGSPTVWGSLDLDEPIYRIYPVWFFEQALRLKQLVLVPPSMWEDPYEVLAEGIGITDPDTGKQSFLDRHLAPVYAQAWSRTVESDTLLRAYSRVVLDATIPRNTCPRDEGIRVRSTPRKLVTALKAWCPTDASLTCFIGRVTYVAQAGLNQHVANLVGRHGLEKMGSGPGRAAPLFLKRSAFAQEAEVRVVYVEERKDVRPDLVRVPIDPNDVFEEVTFDPRLVEFERKERELVVRNLGYAGSITKSDLYQHTMLEVVMPLTEGAAQSSE